MQADIVSIPAFTVVGMKLRTKVESAQMAKLWGDFMPRSSEIAAIPNMGAMYGVMDNYDEQTGEFDYMACLQTTMRYRATGHDGAQHPPNRPTAVFATTLPTEGGTYGRIESELVAPIRLPPHVWAGV